MSDALRPDCYAVIFTAQRRGGEGDGYAEAAERMERLARASPGFLAMEHARSDNGFGITVCYWESEASIAAWKRDLEHEAAQARGASQWYEFYTVCIAKVVRAYGSKGGGRGE